MSLAWKPCLVASLILFGWSKLFWSKHWRVLRLNLVKTDRENLWTTWKARQWESNLNFAWILFWEIDWLVFQWIHNGGDKCWTLFCGWNCFSHDRFCQPKTVKSETKLTQKSCFRGLDFLLEFAIIFWYYNLRCLVNKITTFYFCSLQ